MHRQLGAIEQLSEIENSGPTTLVVGAGLAGLVAAIKIKESMPDSSVTVIEKPTPQSNSQMAGQRFRSGIAGRRIHDSEEMLELLAARNQNITTPQMKLFVETATHELDYWQHYAGFVECTDRPEWFGPQMGVAATPAGHGRGRSVLDWFRRLAEEKGVYFIQAEVQAINVADKHVENLVLSGLGRNSLLSADAYVLANGSVGGQMFQSTNRAISLSSHELAFDAGYSLIDTTVHMIHPFGMSNSKGDSRTGCYETDQLSGAKVYLDGLSRAPLYDAETTELLQDHQAHYHMKEIADRFRRHGSVVMLKFPDTRTTYARVAHHYAHTGVETRDGVTVEGSDNLYAVGDASNLGFWINHQERFPGFALLKCLSDAQFCAQALGLQTHPTKGMLRTAQLPKSDRTTQESRRNLGLLRTTNSEYLGKWLEIADGDFQTKQEVSANWAAALDREFPNEPVGITTLSKQVAKAHQSVSRPGVHEPLPVHKTAQEVQHTKDLALAG